MCVILGSDNNVHMIFSPLKRCPREDRANTRSSNGVVTAFLGISFSAMEILDAIFRCTTEKMMPPSSCNRSLMTEKGERSAVVQTLSSLYCVNLHLVSGQDIARSPNDWTNDG